MKLFKKTLSVLLIILLVFSSVTLIAGAKTTEYDTPISQDTANLRFALKLGTSYREAPTPPLVVDDVLIVLSGKKIYKIDAENGDILKEADMVDTTSYSYTQPTYSDGVIYCPLDNATVQAFDFKTLKSKWVYKDALGGQSLTEIIVSDGKVYTGFWNSETDKSNYVCISTKDEDKKATHEEKTAMWTYSHKGGFYWAKGVVIGDFIVFGSDDGTSSADKTSHLFCFDKNTGEEIDSLEIKGDQRSGILYDKTKKTLYFATKAGYLYSVKFASGSFDDETLKTLSLGGASTSTPTLSDGRIYIGVQGEGFGKGYIKVIDAEKMSIVYFVSMKGYPQNELTVSVKDGKTYVYSTYNAGPGGISLIETTATATSAEAKDLFVPDEGQKNYCISPIDVSEDGTLFYKNDSGYIFAVENIENAEVTNSFFAFFIDIFQAIASFFSSIFGFLGF